MKKRKTVDPFYFKDCDHQQIVDSLNQDLPVNLKFNEDLVNRIHARYPLLSKTEIAIIVKAAFQSMRDLLVLGNILNFHNLFFNVKLYFFDRWMKKYNSPSLRVRMTTPPKMRKNEK